MKQLKNQRGLTLIELLAVIVILAIIAAAAAVAIGNIIQNSKDKAILADATMIIDGAKIANLDGACSSDTECKEEELKPFIDMTSEQWDGFEKLEITQNTTTGIVTYNVTYTPIKKIKNEKYKPKKVTTNTDDKTDAANGIASGEALLNAMNGNKKVAAPSTP